MEQITLEVGLVEELVLVVVQWVELVVQV